MKIHADLHAHSAFAGGARAGGKSAKEREKRIHKRFHDSAIFSPMKGVTLLGTGDAQYGEWNEFLQQHMEEVNQGIYKYNGYDRIPENKLVPDNHEYTLPNYILQSEYIFTGPVNDTGRKKRVHLVTLFPDFKSIKELNELLELWDVKHENMARPFITCDTTDEVSSKLHRILDIDPQVEAIPAHVLTPEGVYGGNERIDRLSDFFGDASKRINAIETGLSADPMILGLIPELDNLTLISNADAHSAKLNRVGREFTSLEANDLSYKSIIEAIRKNNIVKTAEFHPTEGRYFLTGHRAGRSRPGNHGDNQYCFFSPKHVPHNDICPQCNEELTIGVLQRAYEICKSQGEDRKLGDGPTRNFVTMVPLIEIVAHALEMKTLTSKTVQNMYSNVMEVVKSEVNLWIDNDLEDALKESKLPDNLVHEILEVKKGNFSFFPGGYDGVYGELRIGETLDFEDIMEIHN